MAEEKQAIIGLIAIVTIIIIKPSSAQTVNDSGMICGSIEIRYGFNIQSFNRLKRCSVIVGNLKVVLLEKARIEQYANVSAPLLREVTGFVLLYRVANLSSVGFLFPNLARIRGYELIENYALIIYDLPYLKQIGLYSLIKIDRGGVIIYGGAQTCYVKTIDWKTIAPRSRHVMIPSGRNCNFYKCSCSSDISRNHCWSAMKCQRFISGPEAEDCHKECLGCKLSDRNQCTLCRHYTYEGKCLSVCPDGMLILPESQHCLTKKECLKLDRWVWKGECVSDCPIDYVAKETPEGTSCVLCFRCNKTCSNVVIANILTIQLAERCVFINGSLTIHMTAALEAMDELRRYLSRIEEVTDYIKITGSQTISSLDFLSSLKRIYGRKLDNNKYSLVVNGMMSLQKLFTPEVTKSLKIMNGTLQFYRNPVLCLNEIEKIKDKFPMKPIIDIDIPQGMNGYSGACEEVILNLKIIVTNETSVIVTFTPANDPDSEYSILYVRVPDNSKTIFVPENCSEEEWFAVSVTDAVTDTSVALFNLRPGSTYAVCVESYHPTKRNLSRSPVINFTTAVGKPKPPFITELVASTSDIVVIRWVNHLDYKKHIVRYELDVYLIEMPIERDNNRDHCKDLKDFKRVSDEETNLYRHALVMKPPAGYQSPCESMCGILSSSLKGSMVQENFDFCVNTNYNGCNIDEYKIDTNSTTPEGFIKTLVLNITQQTDEYQVGNLAPYRDYRFRLRACTEEYCSNSARGVVRTLHSDEADRITVFEYQAADDGRIYVTWEPPIITNGPILAYAIFVLSSNRRKETENPIPQMWCVSSNQTVTVVQNEVSEDYLVKICTSSLKNVLYCTDWKKIFMPTPVPVSEILVWGILVGLIITISSVVITYFMRQKRDTNEFVPLVEETAYYRHESEAVSSMFSDFAPIYPTNNLIELN